MRRSVEILVFEHGLHSLVDLDGAWDRAQVIVAPKENKALFILAPKYQVNWTPLDSLFYPEPQGAS